MNELITINAYYLNDNGYDFQSMDMMKHIVSFDVTRMEFHNLSEPQACELALSYLRLEDPGTEITEDMIVVSVA